MSYICTVKQTTGHYKTRHDTQKVLLHTYINNQKFKKMKSFKIRVSATQNGELFSIGSQSFIAESNVKLTQSVTAYLKRLSNYVKVENLKKVELILISDEAETKTAKVKFTSEILTTSFQVFKALSSLVFEEGERKLSAMETSKSEVLLNVAGTFRLFRKEVSANEYLRAIENRLKVIQAAITIQDAATDKSTLSRNDKVLILTAKEVKKEVRERNTLLTQSIERLQRINQIRSQKQLSN